MSLLSNPNLTNRQAWLQQILTGLPAGTRLLDAGAGELQNRRHCTHLDYVSQDFCQYHGAEGGHPTEGLQNTRWDTSQIDLVSDITAIPALNASFDAVLCSEVLEHVPEPTHALDEFTRLLKPGGTLILTAPFSSIVHMAPYHFCTGFSKYWYQHHLNQRGFRIQTLVANGDWYSLLRQELRRLGGLERQQRNWTWPLAYAYASLGLVLLTLGRRNTTDDLACFGWHCVAVKN